MGQFKWLALLFILCYGQSLSAFKLGINLNDGLSSKILTHNFQLDTIIPYEKICQVLAEQTTFRKSINPNVFKSLQKDSVISNTMTLEQIEQKMRNYPPLFEYGDQRLQIMESLDTIIDFSVRDNLRDEQKLEEIVAFYRKRVEQGLHVLESTKVSEGVHIFKFYSSSVILKSAEGTVAIDFAQGPIGNDYKQGSVANEGGPDKSDYFKTNFYMTKEQIDRLAHLVDVYIITHPHQDHADYSLAKSMIKLGKPVIGPSQLKYKWEDINSGIIVPTYGRVQKFNPCEIFAQFGYQYTETKKLENGKRYGIPSYYLSRDVESVRYLIKIGGIIFIQSAETHTEAYKWLEKAASFGWKVDVVISAGLDQGERSVMKFLRDKQIQYFRLPIHEYEMTHSNGGNRAAPLLKGDNRKAFDQKKLMPLLWGEDFLLTKEVLNL